MRVPSKSHAAECRSLWRGAYCATLASGQTPSTAKYHAEHAVLNYLQAYPVEVKGQPNQKEIV